MNSVGQQQDDLGIDGIGPGTRIGEGGSAVVYRARQDSLDREVAIKVLGFATNDDTRRRFDRERRLMGRLSQHEGMVTVYETGLTARDEPYIMMPLLGASLADEIRVEPMPWKRAASIIADVCRTVGFAHDQGIVHRDLKPGNIMLSSGGRPLVADFGIARIVDTNTNLEATTLALTPAYSPPEALDTTVAQPTGDVYSLGATLYALITGHPPYSEPGSEPTLMTLMNCIVNEPVPSLGTHAPPQLQAILDRSMAKAPDDRYQTVLEMAEALEGAVATATSAAGAPTVVAPLPPAPPARPSRRTPILIVAALVAAVVAVVAVIAAGGDTDEGAAPQTSSIPAAADGAAGTVQDTAVASQDTAVASTSAPPATTVPVLVVAGGEVFLLPFDEPGVNAFTPSIATSPDEALMAFVESGGVPVSGDATADTATETGAPSVIGVSGTDDGVFAGSEGVAPCAPDDLIAALGPDGANTAAWAEVQQVPVDDIEAFVSGLTSTVMAADTRVTDHVLIDGTAEPRQAVLQVGTAVMIDEFGAPRVRCASGSPLAPPEPVEDSTAYVGAAWDTFANTTTAAVLPAPTPVEEFVLTDVGGGPDFIRPVGSSGATDRPLLPGEILATGTFTSFTGLDPASLATNSIEIIFRPEGGDVSGSFAYTIDIQGITLESFGDLTGSYDATTGSITGTGFGTTQGGGVSGSGEGSWTATVDPAAGTIAGVGGDNEVTFDLTFAPYAT